MSFRYDMQCNLRGRGIANAFFSRADAVLSRSPRAAGIFGTICLSSDAGDPILADICWILR